MKSIAKLFLITSIVITTALQASAQGTAFTYQGQLSDNGSPANGNYDLRFFIYDALTGGSVVAGPITNAPVAVSNGLFTVVLDFGSGVFTGPPLWLHIGARSNGVAVAYTALSPRQELTPTPYSITAENLDGTLPGSQLTGTLPGGLLSGTYSGAVTLSNPGNSFTGDGAGLTDLNASSLNSGTVPDARLSANVALLNRNQTFTAANTFTSGNGPAKFTITKPGFAPVDNTNLFTGLSLQYDGSFGESALMSSYNDGFAYLSFYTKAGFGYPITKQMIIDRVGVVSIDQGNYNDGVLNNGVTNGAGLTFGVGSGEGIASKRTAGGNQYGLDFYTSFADRMSIANNGFVGVNRTAPLNGNDWFTVRAPVASGSYGGINIETAAAGGWPFYGYAQAGSITAWTYVDGTDANKWKLYNGGIRLAVTQGGDVGINTTSPSETLEINGTSRIDDNDMYLRAGTDRNHGLGYRSSVFGIFFDGPFLYGFNGGALGTVGPDEVSLKWDFSGNVWVSNNCSVASLTIRGGADLAEPFQISADNQAAQGSVVVIDEENPGKLKVSNQPYDTRVAGVVSGANGVHPGIQMQQEGLLEGGQNVALTGRVYVQADAAFGAIRPGDLLTTSSTPGHAMKVSNHAKAQGAILGKAMTGLKEGRGTVLVLVTLQ
jgi:hypothetical protein